MRVRHQLGRQHSFVEIDRKIFSTVILSLLLIQEGQLSVSGERMCTTGQPLRFKKGSCQFLAKECAQYWLTAWRTKPAQYVWLGKLTAFDMTPLG